MVFKRKFLLCVTYISNNLGVILARSGKNCAQEIDKKTMGVNTWSKWYSNRGCTVDQTCSYTLAQRVWCSPPFNTNLCQCVDLASHFLLVTVP